VIIRQVFPDDSWTLETARGRLARPPFGAQTPNAIRLEQLIRLIWLGEIASLIRLTGVVALGRPATRYCIVADAGGVVVGYASLNAAVGGKGDVQTIAVREDHQGEGIGTALLADLMAAAAARGCRDLFLHVRADNTRARLLYERTGFTEEGVLSGYYQPSGAAAIVMRLCLPRHAPLVA
jgi:ribosomal-protein-alanine acetyltransferase